MAMFPIDDHVVAYVALVIYGIRATDWVAYRPSLGGSTFGGSALGAWSCPDLVDS
jgi:hypothetical protein